MLTAARFRRFAINRRRYSRVYLRKDLPIDRGASSFPGKSVRPVVYLFTPLVKIQGTVALRAGTGSERRNVRDKCCNLLNGAWCSAIITGRCRGPGQILIETTGKTNDARKDDGMVKRRRERRRFLNVNSRSARCKFGKNIYQTPSLLSLEKNIVLANVSFLFSYFLTRLSKLSYFVLRHFSVSYSTIFLIIFSRCSTFPFFDRTISNYKLIIYKLCLCFQNIHFRDAFISNIWML